jgi:hypothetical protein
MLLYRRYGASGIRTSKRMLVSTAVIISPHGLQESIRVLPLEMAEIAPVAGEEGALPLLLYL